MVVVLWWLFRGDCCIVFVVWWLLYGGCCVVVFVWWWCVVVVG